MTRDRRTLLINIPLVRACIVKWNEGRAKHGDLFDLDPIAEAFDESIDGVNYLDQAQLMLPLTPKQVETVEYCRNMHILIAERLQGLWREMEGGERK